MSDIPKTEDKHAGGCPTKYEEKYCDKMIEYFDIKPYKRVKLFYYYKNGEKKEIIKEIPNDLPTFEGFASSIGIVKKTLLNWTKSHKEFLHAYRLCKEYQKNILVQNGLANRYNCLFAKFVAINATDMRDKQELDNKVHLKADKSILEIIASSLNKKDEV
jgi:hypothetical protein